MRITFTSLIVLLALTSTSAALAADKVDWTPCKSEIEKFCKNIKGEEEIYQCLLKHDVDLSKNCDNNSHSKYEEVTGKTKK